MKRICLYSLFSIISAFVAVVEAGKFENFIVNVEEITKIAKECEQTVEAQKEIIANLTNKIAQLEAKDEALNFTLTTMQGMVYRIFSYISDY